MRPERRLRWVRYRPFMMSIKNEHSRLTALFVLQLLYIKTVNFRRYFLPHFISEAVLAKILTISRNFAKCLALRNARHLLKSNLFLLIHVSFVRLQFKFYYKFYYSDLFVKIELPNEKKFLLFSIFNIK